MQPVTLGEVRELLSGPAASAFFEAWSRADSERAEAQAQYEELCSQIVTVEARVQAAEQIAREATQLAEQQQRRLVGGCPQEVRPFVEREVEALAKVALTRASAALDEARERRARAALLNEQAIAARSKQDAMLAERSRLRSSVSELGAYVGDACLFFEDAEQPGGAFVVPLQPLDLDGRELLAFELHRLAPKAPLSAAVAVRDTLPQAPSGAAEEVSEESDPFATPSERRPRARRKKEKS